MFGRKTSLDCVLHWLSCQIALLRVLLCEGFFCFEYEKNSHGHPWLWEKPKVVPDSYRPSSARRSFPPPGKVGNKYIRKWIIFLTCEQNFGIDRSNRNKRLYTLPSLSDLTNTANYTKVVDVVAERVKGTGLNVLFNNAGISSKFTRLGLVKQEQITDALLVNTVAPIMLTKVRVCVSSRAWSHRHNTNDAKIVIKILINWFKAFLPLLKTAAKNAADKTGLSVSRAAVINMTSILASIAQNNDGGFYPYRCSKV